MPVFGGSLRMRRRCGGRRKEPRASRSLRRGLSGAVEAVGGRSRGRADKRECDSMPTVGGSLRMRRRSGGWREASLRLGPRSKRTYGRLTHPLFRCCSDHTESGTSRIVGMLTGAPRKEWSWHSRAAPQRSETRPAPAPAPVVNLPRARTHPRDAAPLRAAVGGRRGKEEYGMAAFSAPFP